MDKSHREAIGMAFSFAVIVVSLVVVHEFLISLAWASIIAVAIDYNIENRDDALAALTKFTAEFVDSSAFLTKLD